MRDCPDCGVKPGEVHNGGCDVERCCLCGGQAISCDCVYVVNGMDRSRLEFEHEQIYVQGPTQEMSDKLEEEEKKYGGRLPWTGRWPNEEACEQLGLWCYPSGSGFVACEKGHPGAMSDLNRLYSVARWDKHQRRWVDQRN